jgi:hypothetical protein
MSMRRVSIESRIKGAEAAVCAALVLWFGATGVALSVAWAGVIGYAAGAATRYLMPLIWFSGYRAALIRSVLGVLLVGCGSVLAALWAQSYDVHWLAATVLLEVFLLAGSWFVLPEVREATWRALGGIRTASR